MTNQQPYPPYDPFPKSQPYPQYPPSGTYQEFQTGPSPPPYDFAAQRVPQAQQNFNAPNPNQFYNTGDGQPFDNAQSFGFSDIKIRHAFIRKVYSILTVQLLISIAFISLFLFFDPIRVWFHRNNWVHWLIIAGTFIIILVLACCDSVTRKYPLNMILLFGFTILESLLLGSISARYSTNTVLIAVGITALVVVGLTIFSFQTKIDFTGAGTYLFVAVLVLFGFGILAIFIRSKILNIIYSALGAGIFSMYLVFDTQLMLGGKHKYSISPEEYIMASLNLYLDIINLFLMILNLVGSRE